MSKGQFRMTASMLTGVERLDRDHQAAFTRLDRMARLIEAGSVAEATGIAREVATFMEEHFAFEEEVFARAGYPRLDDHRKSHEEYRANFYALLEAMEGGQPRERLETMLRDMVTAGLRQLFQEDLDAIWWCRDHGIDPATALAETPCRKRVTRQ